MTRSILVGLVAALALGLVGVPAGAENGATYSPPFEDGPAGGGTGSYSDRGDDGRIVIGRVYPVPGPIQCPGGGAFAKYEVGHTLTGPISTVTATFTEAAVDQFVFVKLSVRDEEGEWLDTVELRGPLLLEGDITLELDDALFAGEDGYEPGDVLTVQFGLQMASACPHVNGGTVRFTEITVS
jgi:hypothetical protein